MKYTDRKKLYLSVLSAFFGLIFTAAFVFIGAKVIPKSITYTAIARQKSPVPDYKETAECLYDNVYAIIQDGPFTISAYGDEIYIFSDSLCLYRIKANLSEFPPSDREAILSGIDISDRASLFEIAQYMES